jgi:hypothetical protein
MRWQEQLTVTTYEMQWTVRYFLYLSRKWEISTGTGVPTGSFTTIGTCSDFVPGTSSDIGTRSDFVPGTSSDISTSSNSVSGNGIYPSPVQCPGAIAYSRRKKAMWEDLMSKADRIFRRCNPAYESPL